MRPRELESEPDPDTGRAAKCRASGREINERAAPSMSSSKPDRVPVEPAVSLMRVSIV